MASATVMLVIGATGAMAWLLTVEQVAVQMAAWMQVVATEPWLLLLLFSICLLLGIFIEPLAAAQSLAVVMRVTYIPPLSLWLPRLIQSL